MGGVGNRPELPIERDVQIISLAFCGSEKCLSALETIAPLALCLSRAAQLRM
ncbi:MAG: hypothetical protein HW419_1364, partial [Deltaproteobacteria bacterium]|nr:hypothetical protein [Deltaproteobacteria bacterium]